MAYLNNWHGQEDIENCINVHNPDFERLYQHYVATSLVVFFGSRLVLSFIKDVDEFIGTKYNIMLVVSEDLAINWRKRTT